MRVVWIVLAGAAVLGCSARKAAIGTLGTALGDAVARGGTTYSRDDDPELIAEAGPAALKTIEGLIDESPAHTGLLLTAASGFTQYAYAYVQCEADYVEDRDLARSTELRDRARKLYRRALDYGLRGIESSHRDFQKKLDTDAPAALASMRRRDVPLLHWTANAWGGLIALSKDNADMMADLPLVASIARRALELEPEFGDGALHDFFIAYEGGRPAAAGGSAEAARRHLAEARRIGGNRRVAPLVIFAETVLVAEQNRAEFERLIGEALAMDVELDKNHRLANLIHQKRARWLLNRMDTLFVE